jgi:hypothetical protein
VVVEAWAVTDRWWTVAPIRREYRVIQRPDKTTVTQSRVVPGGDWQEVAGG